MYKTWIEYTSKEKIMWALKKKSIKGMNVSSSGMEKNGHVKL